jgi:hypothetical protein
MVGGVTKLFLAFVPVKSVLQATVAAAQFWTGTADVATSFAEAVEVTTEAGQASEQLEALEEAESELQEERLSNPVLPVPGVPRY